MENVDPTIPLPSAVIVNPAAMQASQETPSQTADDTPRNADFDSKMREFSIAESSDVMNEKLSTADYMKRAYEREMAEYAELEKWKDDTTLSANQRAELNSRMQMLDYMKESRELQEQYLENPNDPDVKAKYEAREGEMKEYRQLMQNSEEFKDSKSMEKMRELEKDLDNAQSPQEKMAVKMEMAETMREFRKELMNDPEAMDKMISFVESNKDNAVIQKTGLIQMVDTIKERQAEMGKGKEDDLENTPVTPSGAAKTGGVAAENAMAKDAADKEVVAATDDGKNGKIDPVRMDVTDAKEIQVNAGGPGQQRESNVSAGM